MQFIDVFTSGIFGLTLYWYMTSQTRF